jgi:hypothetical protein
MYLPIYSTGKKSYDVQKDWRRPLEWGEYDGQECCQEQLQTALVFQLQQFSMLTKQQE